MLLRADKNHSHKFYMPTENLELARQFSCRNTFPPHYCSLLFLPAFAQILSFVCLNHNSNLPYIQILHSDCWDHRAYRASRIAGNGSVIVRAMDYTN